MQMAEQFDISTLAWVKGEIDETLKQARVALEAFADDPDDESQLEFCISYVHQVHGTLNMVELLGAALFAEEIEKFAVALRDEGVEEREQGFELLMRAILQLPDYLESLLAGQRDNPITLLPLLNDMRSLRGEQGLDQEAYFSPDLSVEAPAREKAPPAGMSTQALAKKVHPYLIPALTKLIKGDDKAANLKVIATVNEKLLLVAEESLSRRSLWIASAVVEALRDGSLELSNKTKALLGKIEQLVRVLAAKGESGLAIDPLNALNKALLYQLANSSAAGTRAAAVKDAFALDSYVPTGGAVLGGMTTELKQTVSADIMDELSRAKDVFDIFVRSDKKNPQSLEPMVESLGNMAETLNMLQEEELRDVLRTQVGVVQQLLSGDADAGDDTLMGIAGAILAVESALRDWGSVAPLEKADAEEEQVSDAETSPEAVAEHQRVIRQVMSEARDDLIKAREAVNGYLEQPEDKGTLETIPALMHQVIGSLMLLSYKRVAQILSSCSVFIERELVSDDAIPSAERLDALADAVMSIEYYLEAFVQSRVHPGSVLDVAENAVAVMGYPVIAEDAAALEEAVAAEELTLEETPEAEEVAAEEEVSAVEPSEEIEGAAEEATPTAEAPTEEIIEETEVISLEPIEAEDETAAGEVVSEEAAVTTEAETEVAVEEAAAPRGTATVEVDDEILEIFIEEAEEELENIGELLPKWSSNPSDEESLKELRRCFHTLKGSGRLVGASEVGEFAWAFENMLNSIIDGTLATNTTIFDLLEQASDVLPLLVERFKGNPVSADDAEMLRGMAEEIARPGGVKAAEEKPAVAGEPELVEEAVAEEPVTEEAEAAPAAGLPDLDPVLMEIYSKEAQGHLEVVRDFITEMDEGGSRKAGEPIIRALHTLKGSSHMAGITDVSDVSVSLEKYCKTLQALHEKVDDKGLKALHLCVEFTDAMLAYLEEPATNPYPDNSEAKQLADEVYADVQHLEHVADAKPEAGLASVAEAEEAAPAEEVSIELEEGLAEELIAETEEAAPAEEVSIELEGELAEELLVETEEAAPVEGLLAEAEEVVLEEELQPEAAPEAEPAAEELVEMALDAVSAPEEIAVEAAEEELPSFEVEEKAVEAPAPETVVAAVPAGTFEGDYDPDLLEIFLEEGVEILDASEHTLQEWVDNPGDRSLVELMQRQLHTLKGGARMAGITPIGDLSHSLESTFESVVDGLLERSPQMVDLLQLSHDRLVTMLEQVSNHEPVVTGDDLIAQVDALSKPQAAEEDLSIEAPVEAPAKEHVEEAVEVAEKVPAEALVAGLDALEPMFARIAECQVAWQRDVNDDSLFDALSGAVDTLNRGAHAAAVVPLIEIADGLQVLVKAISDGHVIPSEKVGDLFALASERMQMIVGQYREQKPLDNGQFLVNSIRELVAEGLAREEGISEQVVVEIERPKKKEMAEAEAEAEAGGKRRKSARVQHEVVRVRADLLDNLVNFAGEVSIYRSRVEQQIGSFGSNLEEMDSTIVRLRDQLRQVEIETEAQIDSRRAEARKAGYDDFDPLEFDRFTNMQTLSRAMVESLNDLLSIEDSLSGLSRETETLLLQQSRVNTELQESLMQTRTVPLVENAPRLRRVVRQTASELGKRTNLRFQGAEIEMDRNVIERMMAPLEHMLRNSIAHGIEDKASRKKAGKKADGTIVIALSREGSEIVIRVSDDGAGINLDAVKRKAIDRGLMQPDAKLSDQEIMHFILESGFSTAASLTQVSGRGVGMDVVNSEIKQLGGVLELESEYGKGTTFTVRLPLTLTVSRALLVHVADEVYAIPLPSISGIERIAGVELEALLKSENPTFNWVGEDYNLMHLTSVLGAGKGLVHLGTKQPVLLTSSGGHRMAFAVDSLIGSREIVVKSLGAQLSTLQDLAGATILADGSVALIIDMPALIRRGFASLGAEAVVEEAVVEEAEREPVVMVVDDSITVRKVTERLLKRNNMQCVTAKDGVDAIAVLDEVMPDVMLLDIEMPRMDGFELATHIRNSDRLKQIPIIMITSRTGEKHRERAMEIGVNEYMGKPYTEADLLDNIEKLLEKAE